MLKNFTRVCKNLVLPKGKHFRKLLFGLASGCVVNIDFQHSTGLYLGLYEKEVERHFRTLLHQGDNCFDVGGKGGYDALIMAKLTGGKIVSFECEEEAAEEMRQTFAQNPFPVQTVKAFVGNRNDADFTSLDVAASQTFVPDFIKMDIEGAEVEALLGAETILSTRKPSLIVEVHGRDEERQCLKLLSAHGYNPEIVNQRGWLKEQRPVEHNRWLVCLGRVRQFGVAESEVKMSQSNKVVTMAIVVSVLSIALWTVLGAMRSDTN